jgi:hypothetical protein
MGVLRGSSPGIPVRDRPLLWSPPTLTSPITAFVDHPAEQGMFSLAAGQDYIIQMPSIPFTGVPPTNNSNVECQLTFQGGRNIVLIGGQITAPAPARCSLTSPYADGDTTLQVDSTASFPSTGFLNLGGYNIVYTGKTPTTFTGVSRPNTFAYSNAVGFPVPVGQAVWTGEVQRGGISFRNYSGIVHIEGLLIDGSIIDGIHSATTQAGTAMQIQNSRIGPCQNADAVNSFDGHPDCLQLLAGPTTLRMDRVTGWTTGRGILNKHDSGNVTSQAITRDVNFYAIDRYPADTTTLWDNSYGETTSWDCANCYGDTRRVGGRVSVASTASDPSAVDRQIINASPAPDFCPEGVAGVGYVSPGYA